MEHIIRDKVAGVLRELNFPDVDFSVEHPADSSHGDYAINAALVLAKKVGKNPREIAQMITEKLSGMIAEVDHIEIAGAGFINFFLVRNFFKEKIAHINENSATWGYNTSWAGKKVLIEYTDPNPFKEFHVGHLFTNTVGEALSRIFHMNGADVKRVNYQGDVGLHVAYALWGMRELGIAKEQECTARDLGRSYAYGATAYKNQESRAVTEIREINKKIYDRSDDELNALYDKGRSVSLAYFESLYTMLDTKFDAYFFESETGPKGKELVLSHPEIFVESEGARIFKGEAYGLHTRVFISNESLPTYEAKELALAKLKEERLGVYDWSVISTANEVTEYFKVLLKAMSFVYPELAGKTEHIGHGTVRLDSGKMSSRTGDVIPAIDFIEEVIDAATAKMDAGGKTAPDPSLAHDIALGAIKYATLRGNISQNSIFEKDKALSFEGNSGPYLQYTHARIGSVLVKAAGAGIDPRHDTAPDTAYNVERVLYRFEEVIAAALRERAPHVIVVYLTELASAFNTFYSKETIVDIHDTYAPYKCALAQAVKTTLKNGLFALGIKAPEKM